MLIDRLNIVNNFYMVSELQSQPKYLADPVKTKSLRQIRESLMLSKAELSRKAGVSTITISRIEQGMPCRMDTQRKILLALGLTVSEREMLFGRQRK